MSLKAELYTKLLADAPLAALIGTNLFPDKADQKTSMPYITYQDVSQETTHHLGGVSASGFASVSVQFSIWAATPTSRSLVEAALRIALDGKHKQYFGSIWINSIKYTNGHDTTEDSGDGSQDNNVYGKFMDFEIVHERATS